MANIYVSSVGWTAVTAWAALTAYSVGNLRRQLAAPTAGNQRVWRCTTAGTSGAAEPTWTLTTGSTTADATAVWTEVTGQETYNWTAPHASIVPATSGTWQAAGDTVYVAHNHAETQTGANLVIAPTTTTTLPCFIYCVNSAGSVPPAPTDLATTATISTTGAYSLNFNGGYYTIYGITFNSGSGSTATALNINNQAFSHATVFINCSFRKLGTTASTSAITYGPTSASALGNYCTFINCTIQFGNVGDQFNWRQGTLIWKGTSDILAGSPAVPTTLFNLNGNSGGDTMLLEGLDLSTVTGTFNSTTTPGKRIIIKDCKLASTLAFTAPANLGSGTIFVQRSDATATNYRNEKYTHMGTQLTETTVVRTNGASDGTTPISFRVTSLSDAQLYFPFECTPIVVNNAATGTAVTVTMEGLWSSTTLPTNENIWLDVSYLGSTSSPIATVATTFKSNALTTATAHTASTVEWDSLAALRADSTTYSTGAVVKVASNPGRVFFCTTAGITAATETATWASAVDGGSVAENTVVFRAATRFNITANLSAMPAQVGYIYAYTRIGLASATFYVCPRLTLA